MVIEKIAGSIKYCAILNLLLRRTRAEENHLECGRGRDLTF